MMLTGIALETHGNIANAKAMFAKQVTIKRIRIVFSGLTVEVRLRNTIQGLLSNCRGLPQWFCLVRLLSCKS